MRRSMAFNLNIRDRYTAKVIGMNWLSGGNILKFAGLRTFNSFVCHKIVIRKSILLPVYIFATLELEKKKATYRTRWKSQ